MNLLRTHAQSRYERITATSDMRLTIRIELHASPDNRSHSQLNWHNMNLSRIINNLSRLLFKNLSRLLFNLAVGKQIKIHLRTSPND